MARIGHKKSRNGCMQCKKRHVKCDEQVPCGACKRHLVTCSLGALPSPDSVAPSIGQRSKTTGEQVVSIGLSNAPQLATAYLSCSQISSQLDATFHNKISRPYPDLNMPGSWISHTQLIHHYTNTAYRTLSFSSEVVETLQSEVPQEAFLNPFLLHEILAFSGFHMAFLHTERRYEYLLQASYHQSLAIRGTRDALKAMDADNCHSLYATSIFLIINAFAAAFPICGRSLGCTTPIQMMVEIFTLVSGTGIIIRSWEKAIRNGPLKGLFMQCAHHESALADLRLLLRQLPKLKDGILNATSLSVEEATTIGLSIDALEVCVVTASRSRMLAAPAEVRAIFIWPMLISPEYLDMLRQRRPPALAVLAHYAVLISMAEERCWFLQAWGQALLHELTDVLGKHVDGQMIIWPRQFIASLTASRFGQETS